jgi:hypothetical protein
VVRRQGVQFGVRRNLFNRLGPFLCNGVSPRLGRSKRIRNSAGIYVMAGLDLDFHVLP